jgi:hypothetical protein
MATSAGDGTVMIAFTFSVIAGIAILASSGMMLTFGLVAPYGGGMMGGYYGMMNGYYAMMQGFGFGGWFYGLMAIGVISGIIIVAGALMIYTNPSSAAMWGVVILAFSLLSLFGMGGFFFGALLGVLGGVFALTTQKSKTGA